VGIRERPHLPHTEGNTDRAFDFVISPDDLTFDDVEDPPDMTFNPRPQNSDKRVNSEISNGEDALGEPVSIATNPGWAHYPLALYDCSSTELTLGSGQQNNPASLHKSVCRSAFNFGWI
jgi:hypothetical protein